MTYEFVDYKLYDEAGNVVSCNVVPLASRGLYPHQDALHRLCNHLARAGGGSHHLWWGVHPTRMAVDLETIYRITPLRSLSLPLDLLNPTSFNVVTIHNGVARDSAGRELHTRDGIVWMDWPKLEFPAFIKTAIHRIGYKPIDQKGLIETCVLTVPMVGDTPFVRFVHMNVTLPLVNGIWK